MILEKPGFHTFVGWISQNSFLTNPPGFLQQALLSIGILEYNFKSEENCLPPKKMAEKNYFLENNCSPLKKEVRFFVYFPESN